MVCGLPNSNFADMQLQSLHAQLEASYTAFLRSFLRPQAEDIRQWIAQAVFAEKLYWAEPYYQVSPAYLPDQTLAEYVQAGELHPEIERFFTDKQRRPYRLHWHQAQALRLYQQKKSFILTSGTGSGKSLAYFLPIMDALLREPDRSWGVQALIVYPMNALANSQLHALQTWAKSYKELTGRDFPVRFARYTGETQARDELRHSPPHIILTNYMMLELILLRKTDWERLFQEGGIRFLVFDELHVYRGRRAADVAMLIRRLRQRYGARDLLCIGTSATLADGASLTPEARQSSVPRFASRFFGEAIAPEQVIEERLTYRFRPDPPTLTELQASLDTPFSDAHPLIAWIEHEAGLTTEEEDGVRVYRRRTPRTLSELQDALASQLSISPDKARAWLQEALSYIERHSLLAFRLHQFVRQVGALLATLEPPGHRRFVLETNATPSSDGCPWWRLHFCRHCGQEYYEAAFSKEGLHSIHAADPEQLDELHTGYAAIISRSEVEDRLDTDDIQRWEKRGEMQFLRVSPDGALSSSGIEVCWQKGFKVCVKCAREWHYRERGTYKKLASLTSEGRSSSTMALALNWLRHAPQYGFHKKLLSFTDNRQDASLQAGHFNDFIHILFMRAALLRILRESPERKYSHTEVIPRILELLEKEGLLIRIFARDKDLDPRSSSAQTIKKAVELLLTMLLLEDLWRIWRVLYPNLFQLGLVKITFAGIDTAIDTLPETLKGAAELIHTLLLRFAERRAIYERLLLDETERKSRLNAAAGLLESRWYELLMEMADSLSRPTAFTTGSVRSTQNSPYPRLYGLGPRSALARLVGKKLRISSESERHERLLALLDHLRRHGFLRVEENKGDKKYQILPSSIVWQGIDRVPEGFWGELYTMRLEEILTLEAREHTAQVVRQGLREERERRFRGEAQPALPYLVCSPTMELGIDIAQLEGVHLRNIPPSPANYAQRSGRAGRQGQGGIIMTFAGAYSPYERYFYNNRVRMISGTVRVPPMDLNNRTLWKAHLHAFWLGKLGIDLGSSMKDILDLDQPDFPLREGLQKAIQRPESEIQRWAQEALRLWQYVAPGDEAPSEADIFRILTEAPQAFDRAFDRWRALYRQLKAEIRKLHSELLIAQRDEFDQKQKALGLAKVHEQLLLNDPPREDTDFYPYRYLATEGFLPGYNFPSLPVRAHVPAPEPEYLSRPRPIGIYEYAPGAFVYHEGDIWQVSRLYAETSTLMSDAYKLCDTCGAYTSDKDDICPHCQTPLFAITKMVKLSTVRLEKRHNIISEEEERNRRRQDLSVHYRPSSVASPLSAEVSTGVHTVSFTYLPLASLLFLNQGSGKRGFHINLQTGECIDKSDPYRSDSLTIPTPSYPVYVQGEHPALIIQWKVEGSIPDAIESLAVALHMALVREYEIAEEELDFAIVGDTEPRILFYEYAEGGLGILRKLVEENATLQQIARRALEVCHFSPEGEDLYSLCEKACYDCLLTYTTAHRSDSLNRHVIQKVLVSLSQTPAQVHYTGHTRESHYQHLKRLIDSRSPLEKQFLDFLYQNGYRLPDEAQKRIDIGDTYTVSDFFFHPDMCIYCDGKSHDKNDVMQRDQGIRSRLREMGYRVLVLRTNDSIPEWWEKYKQEINYT